MKRIYVIAFFSLSVYSLQAQVYFSDSTEVFFRQALSGLKAMGTEPANKVAFDFNNAWTGKFTNAQQEEIHSIALLMQKKGYSFHPHFWYFFSYLAFSTEQLGLNSQQITQVLAINSQVVKTMNSEEYTNFLLGMNMFMARRILGKSKFLLSLTEGGSFEFKLFDKVIEEEPVKEEPPLPLIVGKEEPQPVDSWRDQTTADWNDASNSGWQDAGASSWDSEPIEEGSQQQKLKGVTQDYVQAKKSLYKHPSITGPGIVLENNNLLISTPYDSFKIKETDGTFLLKSRTYAGKSAVINWPAENVQARGAVVNLGEFILRPDREDFWTPNATLTFDHFFNGSVEGVFQYKSVPRRPNTLSGYPVFTSNRSNIRVKLSDSRVTYIGGVQISGNHFAGTSVSRKRGTLQILDGNGNTVTFRGELFHFNEDNTITSPNASFTVKYGSDSIYHPAMDMRYDMKNRTLVALRKKEFNVTPFTSTYFQMTINADIINWDMETDSVNFSVLNGKDLIPVTLESKDFFNEVRFSKLAAGLRFHPVITSVHYADKHHTREFVDAELATEYGISVNEAKMAMRVLKTYGFAKYDPQTGVVQLTDKAFLYNQASGRKIDYDNIMIPSHEPSRPNVTWRLDSGDLKIRGVKRFYLTSDFKTYVEPFEGEMKVEKGRKLVFDGALSADDFIYKGKGFEFDYDGFYVDMRHIDSIHIDIQIPDSLKQKEPEGVADKKALSNHLNKTSGTLYLNYPDNKSGIKRADKYPYLISDSEATVYFDGPEILNGAYDKSVRFIIPPFEADSAENNSVISYNGVFNSGGIFPNFNETLHLMPDQSLGFEHQIPPEGYNLYGTFAKTYEKIRLDNNGIRGGGKIDFITSTIYSEDFVYYPDSVAAVGKRGEVRSGVANGVSYPKVAIGPYRMHWEPRIDSMHLESLRKPFDFYENTATLDGAINITANGLYGQGKLLTMGSKLRSKDIAFTETAFSARHAQFEVLTDNPQKPAMKGNDIKINFDLIKRVADLSPEKKGVAAISFPYAQMNTSITNAVWDLNKSIVTMTKPPEVPIGNSYFYTTRKELDSLAFNATQAVYDMKTKKLNVKGIPYIIVADAKIIPEGNETTILENSELQTFNNARVIIDTLNEFHKLHNGEIKIYSRNEFSGSAIYQLTSAGKTFDIKFDEFELKDVKLKDGTKHRMTVSGGSVPPESNLIIAPGFYYKGDVEMFAYKKALELTGYVKPIMSDPGYDYWIEFKRKDDNTQVEIDVENAYFEDNEPVISGLHYNLHGEIYTSFAEKRDTPSDEDFFIPKGIMLFDTTSNSFKIEKSSKATGESYDGYTMIYNDRTKDIIFEGPAIFLGPSTKDITLNTSILGVGNAEKSEYSIDAFIQVGFKDSESYMQVMAGDLIDIIERFGSPVANDLSIELMYKLANIVGDQPTREYEVASLKEYKPLYTISESFLKPLVISGVKMKWSQAHKAWYNTTKLGISNIFKTDLNAKLDGFLEIRKDEANDDIFNLFIQAAPGTWYYISYANNTLLLYSSNSGFNTDVDSRSNYGKARPGELVLVKGDETETLTFINNFREKYFGITEPYDLISPEDADLGDEEFETIKKEDDGFGF